MTRIGRVLFGSMIRLPLLWFATVFMARVSVGIEAAVVHRQRRFQLFLRRQRVVTGEEISVIRNVVGKQRCQSGYIVAPIAV